MTITELTLKPGETFPMRKLLQGDKNLLSNKNKLRHDLLLVHFYRRERIEYKQERYCNIETNNVHKSFAKDNVDSCVQEMQELSIYLHWLMQFAKKNKDKK